MTTDEFDGYKKWLGISTKKRPPSHYDLLGISINEDDHDVIQAAVEQRRNYVLTQMGLGHDVQVKQIKQQIDEAELTLLNPDMRRDYDRSKELFAKRRMSRRVDPHAQYSPIRSQPGRTVGEGSELGWNFTVIVTVVLAAFCLMATLSFYLPWSQPTTSVEKKAPDEMQGKPQAEVVAQPKIQVEQNAPVIAHAPVIPKDPEMAAPATNATDTTQAMLGPEGLSTKQTENRLGEGGNQTLSFYSLVDSKSLKDWKHNESAQIWEINESEIVAQGGRSQLYYTAKPFSDFDLQLEVNHERDSNGGIYVRCQRNLKTGEYPTSGYEIQVLGERRNPEEQRIKILTGSINKDNKPAIQIQDQLTSSGKWFRLRIVAQGNQITTFVNDQEASKYTDNGVPNLEGYIALQSHTGVVRYRNLQVKPLSSTQNKLEPARR